MFLLFEGSEFLHRVLYDAGIKHDYHLVHGADHLGCTVWLRFTSSYRLHPIREPSRTGKRLLP